MMDTDELFLYKAMQLFLQNKDVSCLRRIFEKFVTQHPHARSVNENAFPNFRKNGNRETLLRLPDVIKKVGLKRSTIYKKIQQQKFPAPIKIGERASAWPETEIAAWISAHKDTN